MLTADWMVNVSAHTLKRLVLLFVNIPLQLVSLPPDSEASTKDGWPGANRNFSPQTEGALEHSDLEVDMMSDVDDETASNSSKG